jgi:hypothetical protein
VTQPDAGRRVVAGPTAGNGRAGLCGAALACVARGALGSKAVGLVPEAPDVLVDLVLVQVVFHHSVSRRSIRRNLTAVRGLSNR